MPLYIQRNVSFTGGSHGHLRGPILAVDMDRPKTIEEEINGEKKNLEKMRSMNLPDMVAYCVDQMEVIDVHTHLFPPTHDGLMLWGIDELLTYHYLVAEYFVTAPLEMKHETFFQLSKADQSSLVWEALFVDRSPLSEATRGVCTVLKMLGIGDLLETRSLHLIREWYSKQDPHIFVKKVFELAKVKYCVMTNIPFDDHEAKQWDKASAKEYSEFFKAALRVDPILKGDWNSMARALARDKFPQTVKGAQDFLVHWSLKIDSIYFMASTPSKFKYHEELFDEYTSLDIIEPGLCLNTQMIDKILIPVATSMNLPITLKLGACRGMNPKLDPCGGGDGVEVIDPSCIASLCRRYPKVKFLTTFLSRVNQHEACILANKFRNLHLYGCWWYCNNPSMIKEITEMRVELLGTAFTAQHSDCRVLDQLIYKWAHSKVVICKVLVEMYQKTQAAGWTPNAEEVQRAVKRLFGESYHEFLMK